METAWIVITAIVGASVVIAVAQIFGGKGSKRDHLKDAETKAQDVRAAAEAALTVELETLEGDRRDLEAIKTIENDAERLQALADYANRRRKR